MGISPLLGYSLSKPQLFLQINSAYVKRKRQIVSRFQEDVKREKKNVICHSYCREGNYFMSLLSPPPRAEGRWSKSGSQNNGRGLLATFQGNSESSW